MFVFKEKEYSELAYESHHLDAKCQGLVKFNNCYTLLQIVVSSKLRTGEQHFVGDREFRVLLVFINGTDLIRVFNFL